MPAPLYYGDLVNRASPLNRGLVSWWLTVPWYKSGPRFIDIAGRNHGVLTNGPAWQGAMGRPGGFGSLTFDGSDDYVELNTNFGDGGATAFSWACWFYTTSPAAGQCIIARYDGSALFQLHITSESLKCSYGVPGFDGVPSSPVSSLIARRWYNAIFTFSATGVGTLYQDGLQTGQDVSVTGDFTSATSINFGRRSGDTAEKLSGAMDDIRRWNRELSASEAYLVFQDSRQGYPHTLNRIRRPVVFDLGGGGGTTTYPWHYYAQQAAVIAS